MSPGPTFDRVYIALKAQLMSARFAPGAHLEPSAIGDELSASVTPVRDALHRLVGELMVEAPRHNGFQVPAPTEAQLRDLYGWNLRLLDVALARRAGPRASTELAGPMVLDTSETRLDAADLFRRVARRSGSPEQERAISNLSDRLGALRVVENRILQDAAAEMSALVDAYRREDWGSLRHGLGAYHRRRQRAAPEILVAARTFAGAPQTTAL